MWPNPQDTADLVTFTTEEILNGKLHFLRSSSCYVLFEWTLLQKATAFIDLNLD